MQGRAEDNRIYRQIVFLMYNSSVEFYFSGLLLYIITNCPLRFMVH